MVRGEGTPNYAHGRPNKVAPFGDRVIRILRGDPDDTTLLPDGTRSDRHYIRDVIPILNHEEDAKADVFSERSLRRWIASNTTLRWRLRHRGAEITWKNHDDRKAYWTLHHNLTLAKWRTWVFTDSVSLSPNYKENRHNEGLWVLPGDRCPYIKKRRRANSVLHCYGALSQFGLLGPYFITGSINHHTYLLKVLTPMLRDIKNIFAANDATNLFTLQQDGAGAHKDHHVQSWLGRQSITFIPFRRWPGNSPDLSPIEQVWPLLSRHCAPYGSFGVTESQLRSRAQRFFRDFPISQCVKLLQSNRKLMRQLRQHDFWGIPQ